MSDEYETVEDLLATKDPQSPVYCVYPHVYQKSTKHFLDGFPGRVLYAVKANNHPAVIKQIYDAGVRHFDCASLPEIELIARLCPDSTLYYMNPVRLDKDARSAQQEYGVRHFVVDHQSGLAPLLQEINPKKSVIFARASARYGLTPSTPESTGGE